MDNFKFSSILRSLTAVVSAFSLFCAVSCSESNVSENENTSETEIVSDETDTTDISSESTATSEEEDKTTATTVTTAEVSKKNPDKYNTYSMEELFGKKSPLLGYWHTEGRDMYIEYNEFGDEGFTVILLGKDFQIFSSEIGNFAGAPQNVTYELASDVDDLDIANLYNKDTKFSMAVNDDNSISAFFDFGFDRTSTYTFEKSHPDSEIMPSYTGEWGNSSGVEISFTYEEGSDNINLETLFGFSNDIYQIGVPSMYDNEFWIFCPHKDGLLNLTSDYGVFLDAVNVRLSINSDGSVNVTKEFTNPVLKNNAILNAPSVVRHLR